MAEHKHTNRLVDATSPYLLQHAHNRSDCGGSLVATELPRLSGVYRIVCLSTGKIYIGSAVDLRERWAHHRRSLRRGKHANCYLQEAWDLYGEENFEFSILEFTDASELLHAEQAWIDRSRCTDRCIGFNVYDIAGSPGALLAKVWVGFISPDGSEVTITNLLEFCRQQKLDYSSMVRLASGRSKLKSHRGWTHCNSPRKREYVKTYEGFVDPEGRPAGPITNLASFCREWRLDNTHMVAVARGRIYSHRGWTYLNDRQNLGLPKTHSGFIDPEGQRVVITNLRGFCRERGLIPVHMHELRIGRRKSHKGWTWRETDD